MKFPDEAANVERLHLFVDIGVCGFVCGESLLESRVLNDLIVTISAAHGWSLLAIFMHPRNRVRR